MTSFESIRTKRILGRHIWKVERKKWAIISGGEVRRQGERQGDLRFGLGGSRFDQSHVSELAEVGCPPPALSFNRQPGRGQEGGSRGLVKETRSIGAFKPESCIYLEIVNPL